MITLVKFGAAFCGPCRLMKPRWALWAERYARPGVAFEAVEIDADPDRAADFSVTKIPTVVVLVDGREVARRVGLLGDRDMAALMAEHAPPSEA